MASFLVVAADGRIVNALQTPNEGVFPNIIELTDRVIEVEDSLFDIELVALRRYWNASTESIEPEQNKRLALLTPGPYSTGTVNLQFQQQDLNSQAIIEPATFTVIINGQTQEVFVDDGTLDIELTCSDPVTIALVITALRHEPVQMEVVVGG